MRRLRLADLSPEHAAEARRQLAGGGVDMASMALASVANRDLKPHNVRSPSARPKRGMNDTEAAYARELEMRNDIEWWAFESVRLRLADGAWYKPDFAVLTSDHRTEYHEVKGHWREAARVRIKVAADIYPWPFLAVQQREDGGWDVERFPGAV